MKPIFRLILIVSFLTIIAANTACNTTRGVGKDIENAGDGLKKSAERNGAD